MSITTPPRTYHEWFVFGFVHLAYLHTLSYFPLSPWSTAFVSGTNCLFSSVFVSVSNTTFVLLLSTDYFSASFRFSSSAKWSSFGTYAYTVISCILNPMQSPLLLCSRYRFVFPYVCLFGLVIRASVSGSAGCQPRHWTEKSRKFGSWTFHSLTDTSIPQPASPAGGLVSAGGVHTKTGGSRTSLDTTLSTTRRRHSPFFQRILAGLRCCGSTDRNLSSLQKSRAGDPKWQI
jgi:hypothetical protein